MKQIIQSYKNGKIEFAELPYPACPGSAILVKNLHSVVSIGTERSMIELGRKGLLGKARSRPDLVKRFMEKARSEGLYKTFNSAMRRLNEAMPLGYSSVGEVIEVGSHVRGFSPGDRVACIGGGFASHAQYITVPENLCAPIPEQVSSEEAAFGMLGIIAMHAMRCAELQPGERVAVVGLGLLGLMLSQLLNAYGFQVIATDLDENKRKLCQESGIAHCPPAGDEFIQACDRITGGVGVDAVILAVATKSERPVHEAIRISRFRGKIVLMGVADTHPHRNDLWEKEISLVVSKAGGPGIGDPTYELMGFDYPPEYVRWTEKRNLEEFLRLLAEHRIHLTPLITHRFEFDKALDAYEQLLSGQLNPPPIGVLLQYNGYGKTDRLVNLTPAKPSRASNSIIKLGVVGGGMFAKTTMLPALSETKGIGLKTICTARGISGNHIGKQYGFEHCTTDAHSVFTSSEVNAVVILTQHKDHAPMVSRALDAGKHIFVEKPLCISHEELERIIGVYSGMDNPPALMVGYNRRFSKLTKELNDFFKDPVHPLVIQYRVNAGYVPPDHWIHSAENGDGRIIGEICHMVDFMMYLTKSLPVKVAAERVGCAKPDYLPNDNVVINLRFQDGSIGTITYTADGDRALARERIEAYCDGKTAVLNDFRTLEAYANGEKKTRKLRNQDMGYKGEIAHFVELVRGECQSQLPVKDIFYSTKAVLCVHDALNTGNVINIKV